MALQKGSRKAIRPGATMEQQVMRQLDPSVSRQAAAADKSTRHLMKPKQAKSAVRRS